MAELGKLVRAHRKSRQLTLEDASGLSKLSVRFLSEMERGKQTAEIGKVLKAIRCLGLEVVVQPSASAERNNQLPDDQQPARLCMLHSSDHH